jgi:hypothetical protein
VFKGWESRTFDSKQMRYGILLKKASDVKEKNQHGPLAVSGEICEP